MSQQATQFRVAAPSVISKIGDDLINAFKTVFSRGPAITATGQPITQGATQVLRQAKSSAFTRIQRQPFTGKGKIEDIIDIPTGSTKPIIQASTGTKVALTGAAISAPLTVGLLSLDPGGGLKGIGDTFSSFTDTIKPITEGAGGVLGTFSNSPILLGGLIILGGVLLLKK